MFEDPVGKKNKTKQPSVDDNSPRAHSEGQTFPGRLCRRSEETSGVHKCNGAICFNGSSVHEADRGHGGGGVKG